MNGAALRLQGAPNFRDLGGLPTVDGRQLRHGLLFRSQGLGGLSDADLVLLGGLGLRLVCDLRSRGERELHPSRRHPEWTTQWLEFDLDTDGRGGGRGIADILRERPDAQGAEQMMLATYRALPAAFEPELPRLFERLLAEDGLPALLHCTAGKDRTGFAVALLLAALGVSWAAIEADYLRSLQMIDRPALEASTAQVMALFLGAAPTPEVVRAITTVRQEYLLVSFEAITAAHGSVDAYLDACGLDGGRRVALRRRLLTG